jgi:hypothetical protein
MNSTIESTPEARQVIFELLENVDGELSTRSRVVDGLLDLRNAAPEFSELEARVDELLRSVPGVTTVPNGWWLDRLEELRRLT